MKLNGHGFGMSLGVIWGATLFLATIVLILKMYLNIHFDPNVGLGPTLGKIGQFYWGYKVSFFGGILGGVYAFVHGYITGRIMAWLYNKFAG